MHACRAETDRRGIRKTRVAKKSFLPYDITWLFLRIRKIEAFHKSTQPEPQISEERIDLFRSLKNLRVTKFLG